MNMCTVFLCLGLSSAQQFSFFCEHDKIHVPGTAYMTLPKIRPLLAVLTMSKCIKMTMH